MFEARLLPIAPLKLPLSWEQYENIMEDREWMRPVMQQFIGRVLEQTRDWPCKWEFNTANPLTAHFEITEVSVECPWHIAHAQ